MNLLKKGPKAIATIILERKMGKDGSASDGDSYTAQKDGADQDMEPGLDSASEDILSAIDSKDPKALKSALKDFISMCSDYEESKENSSEEDSEEEK